MYYPDYKNQITFIYGGYSDPKIAGKWFDEENKKFKKKAVKVVLTKKELKERVNVEAKATYNSVKMQGGKLTMTECKKEAEKTLRENHDIID